MKLVWLALLAAVILGCTSQMPDVKGSPSDIGAKELRAVLVDSEGNCYISRPKTVQGRDTQLGTVAGMGNFVFFGDCLVLFRDGWG